MHERSSPPNGQALSVRGLQAWYGESQALHGVDIEVGQGEVVALLGRNGAGKSTTLKSIIGIQKRRAGSVLVKDQETIGLRSRYIARLDVGYVPEDRSIYASLTVEENLLLAPITQPGGLSLDEILILFPNLRGRLSAQGSQLSGGEQQMLSI